MLISPFTDFYDYAIHNAWIEDTYNRVSSEIIHPFTDQEKSYIKENLNHIYIFKTKSVFKKRINIGALLVGRDLTLVYELEDDVWATFITKDLKEKYQVDDINWYFRTKATKKKRTWESPIIIKDSKLAYLNNKYNSPIILIKDLKQGKLELNPNLMGYSLHHYFDPVSFLQELLMSIRNINNIQPIISTSNNLIRDYTGHGPTSFKGPKNSTKKARRKLNKKRKNANKNSPGTNSSN